MLNINAKWNPSVDPTVTKQVILVKINDGEFSRTELPVDVANHLFGVNTGDAVSVELFAVNEALGLESEHVTASMLVPSFPSAPSDLVLELVVDNS